jgi:hypothetical protein
MEKVFSSNWNLEDIFSAQDSLITKENLVLQVSNFSMTAVTIQVGQVLGKAKNPENWLDRPSKYSEEALLVPTDTTIGRALKKPFGRRFKSLSNQ